jgi:VanZ family protein
MSKRRKTYLLWRGLFGLLLAGSFVLSVLPGETVAPLSVWSDKLNHAGVFFLLAVLMRLGWRRIGYWKVLVLLSAYGGGIELAQLFAIDRSAEWADLGADVVGIFLGLKIVKHLRALGRNR